MTFDADLAERWARAVAKTLIGLVFLAAGLTIVARDLYVNHVLHPLEAVAGIGLAILGALLIVPDAVVPALKQLGATARDFLPWKNGAPPPGGPPT